ncbi:MAG: outer membrane lipoprotein chaperone LolA [Gammaproteobacteria bacterium]|jgi:outer membrane lipoprotein carrier protein|nr:outer membrane lipoprotein chaperone LolA [Gammaproteobacteria bacterium]MDP6615894.1 outer membrane lipoprotein chaperone LolA [Gammaproteobacteria bacterium]MDP6694288.1 outer membrane lipoprotein chaperone LolA [Gammaproteobacteria bacterium]MDP7042206.1 outer membrane lipoprotein chaperone LolA [Gammaproteobacteria bacterium]
MAACIRLLLQIVALLLIAVAPANAGTNDCADQGYPAVLCGFLTSFDSYRADFEQVVSDEAGEIVEEGSGTLWLQRPGMFRWNYSAPWEQLIVANSTEIWIYDTELEQATVRPADGAIAQTPAGLLAGNLAALENYSITAVYDEDDGSRVTLVPRAGNSDFREIILSFAESRLESLAIQDSFGQHTLIAFENTQRNPPLSADLFSFVLPDGADLIDQRNN